jgi:hypothetical protein
VNSFKVVKPYAPAQRLVQDSFFCRVHSLPSRGNRCLYTATPKSVVPSAGALETEKISHTGLLDVCDATQRNKMQERGHH